MVPLGLQCGNNPKVTYAETYSVRDGACSNDKLIEQWINLQAVKDLATARSTSIISAMAAGSPVRSTTRRHPVWGATRRLDFRPWQSYRSSPRMRRF